MIEVRMTTPSKNAQWWEHRITRGEALRRAAVGAAAGLVFTGSRSPVAARAAVRGGGRIVVIGAGVAGLTCAHRLRQHGVGCTVYEASDRVGGRTKTLRGYFAEGQIVEQGGEAIDTDQHAVRALVAELGLHLDDTFADTPGGLRSNRFQFNGRDYPYHRASDDFAVVYPALQRDLRDYARSPRAAHALDEMSVADWLDARVPGGRDSQLGRLIGEAYCSEDGVDITEGSSLAMITQLGESPRRPLSLYGDSDERFKVRGGVDQIAHRLAARLPAGSIAMETPLVGLRRNGDGSYTCVFSRGGGGTLAVRADRVVLALPFTTLRDVDYGGAGFSRRKAAAIQELGMATNAKLTLQFSRKTWRRDGYDGYIETDLIPGDTWDTTVNQAGRAGIMVVYSGGRRGATYPTTHAHGPAPPAVARETVARLATIYPHLDRDFTGRAHLDAWVHNPWSHGSYAAFLVGQYTRFTQHVRAGREGGVHFAGEHTDTDQQGYIDGAVRTGERAARELYTA
jgi:monoamine oxidase